MNYKYLYLILLAGVFACAGSSPSSQPTPEIVGVLIEGESPTAPGYDSVKNMYFLRDYVPTFTRIFYYKNQQLIQTSYLSDSYHSINGKLVAEKHETRFRTFIIADTAARGIYFDSLYHMRYTRFNRDSLLSAEWAFADNFGKALEQYDEKPAGSNRNDDGDLLEQYTLTDPGSSSLSGTLKLTWSAKKLRDIPYRLSAPLEEKKGQRLVAATLILYPFSIPGTNSMHDTMRVVTRVSKIDNIPDKDELISLFQFAEKVKD